LFGWGTLLAAHSAIFAWHVLASAEPPMPSKNASHNKLQPSRWHWGFWGGSFQLHLFIPTTLNPTYIPIHFRQPAEVKTKATGSQRQR